MTSHHSIQTTDDASYARDMIEALEGMVRPYTGHVNLDKATVVHIARSLRHQSQQKLPTTVHYRDVAPRGPLFRSNVHLALTYQLAHILIGRSFIFARSRVNSPRTLSAYDISQLAQLRTSIASGCVANAIEIVTLCQMLQDDFGLARASYTEFTSCWAALFVILAQRTQDRSTRLRKASEQGMELLKHMSLGFYSATAEKSAIEAMETAIRRLDDASRDQRPEEIGPLASTGTAYDRIRNWAMLCNTDGFEGLGSVNSYSDAANPDFRAPLDSLDFSTLSPLQSLNWGSYSASFPFELGDDFAFITDDIQ